MKYAVVIEQSKEGFWTDVPDLPSYGSMRQEAEKNVQEAIEAHIESLQQHNEPVPLPTTSVAMVDAA